MHDFYMKILSVGAFEVNCYIIKIDGKVFVFDPGAESENIISCLEKNNLIPSAILLTHAHIDHISAVKPIAEKYGVDIYLNSNDEALYHSQANALEPFYFPLKNPLPTKSVFNFSDDIVPIHTPGHTQGGTCFYIKKAGVLISGDTIFNESIGRTDLPGGSYEQLISSIINKVMTLPDNTVIYPGHGPKTSVLNERMNNPYL